MCVRVPLHHELTSAALRAGKHVFTEWPLGANTAEARELHDLAVSAGVRHMVGLQARAAPQFVRMQQLIAEGYVGEVLSATLRQTLPGAGPRRESFAWAVDASKGRVDALDRLRPRARRARVLPRRVPFGERERRDARAHHRGRRQRPHRRGDLAGHGAHLWRDGEGGAAVSVAISSVPGHGSGLRVEVHGSEGVLLLTSDGMSQIAALTLSGARNEDGAVAELPIPDDCWWAPQDLVGPGLNVAQLFRRLGESIRGGATAVPDFAHAVRRHELLDAIQHASDSGERQAPA